MAMAKLVLVLAMALLAMAMADSSHKVLAKATDGSSEQYMQVIMATKENALAITTGKPREEDPNALELNGLALL
ncbi:hypothetical protein ZIOFF_040633 [Zingiber officinale]|uniref:Uncharacterized protein n=1 Tax=Zingiber officinale TaxID=94328 RepID=A0A8J5G4B9_ZINOF|nr:hypothetical protein ZIOFF_040633 [Zingiber officinale]